MGMLGDEVVIDEVVIKGYTLGDALGS